MVAMIATCSESSKRSAISETIGWPVHMEMPKSKRMRPQMKLKNCPITGKFVPISSRQIWIALSSK